MAFSSYAELQTAIASWLARDDLTTYIPDFITLFEATAARKLRVRAMETTASITTTSGSGALPSDFLQVRRLTWTGSTPVELAYVHPTYLRGLYPSTDSGTPSHYTLEASSVVIRPTDDTTTLQLLYYAKTGALSSALQWLFNNHPDAYLFGSLAEAHGFNVDMNQLATWKARRDEVFEEIQTQEFRSRSGMSIRLIGAAP